MKRIIAVSVAAGMLLNTTLPSLAESGTEGGYESQNAADDNSTVNDSLTDAGQLGDETAYQLQRAEFRRSLYQGSNEERLQGSA